jgi:hypothetical protein
MVSNRGFHSVGDARLPQETTPSPVLAPGNSTEVELVPEGWLQPAVSWFTPVLDLQGELLGDQSVQWNLSIYFMER